MGKLQHVLQEVETRKEELTDLVKTLIEFETPAPPARNTKDAQQYVAEFLKQLGFSVDMWDVYPNDPNVVGVLKGTTSEKNQSLIINGHIDVAEVNEGEEWETDPFTPFIKDGHIVGRGAADMKAGMAGSLFALQLLRENGITRRCHFSIGDR